MQEKKIQTKHSTPKNIRNISIQLVDYIYIFVFQEESPSWTPQCINDIITLEIIVYLTGAYAGCLGGVSS